MLSKLELLWSNIKKQIVKGPYTPEALHQAVMINDEDFVKAYIQNYKNNPKQLDHLDSSGHSPIFQALHHENYAIARLLAEAGANVNLTDFRNSTPLHWAASHGELELVKCLIKHGAEISAIDRYWNTPISLAAESGHFAVIKELAEMGADLNHPHATNPLLTAADRGYTNVVGLLLDKGAQIDAGKTNGHTPLLKAVKSGHLETAQLLLDRGAKPENSFESTGGYCRRERMTGKGVSQKRTLLEVSQLRWHDPKAKLVSDMIRKRTSPCFQYRLDTIGYKGAIPAKWLNTLSDEKNQMINDPITLSSGVTYDRESMYQLFVKNGRPEDLRCPKTNKIIFQEELENETNEMIKNDMEEFVSSKEEKARRLENNAEVSLEIIYSSDQESTSEYSDSVGYNSCS